MIATYVMIYVGAWLLTSAGVYAAGRLLADLDQPADNPLLVSLGAGAVWPLVLLGAVEFSSLAAYATAKSMRTPGSIPESWLGADPVNIAGPLR